MPWLLSLEKGGKDMWIFFLTPSASVLKMPAIKVMIGKDERQKELVTNHSLLPSPQK